MSASHIVDLASILLFLAFLGFVAKVAFTSMRPNAEVAQLRAEVAQLRKEIHQQGHTSA